jgi:hypothetical protein
MESWSQLRPARVPAIAPIKNFYEFILSINFTNYMPGLTMTLFARSRRIGAHA